VQDIFADCSGKKEWGPGQWQQQQQMHNSSKRMAQGNCSRAEEEQETVST
jgi:hypothetical protein